MQPVSPVGPEAPAGWLVLSRRLLAAFGRGLSLILRVKPY